MAKRHGPATVKSRPGRLRIVAGKWRSRLLPVAEHDGLRPTSERVRETLFNWLSAEIRGSRCLDAFAGTGALGFEAASRGAAEVTLFEKSPAVARVLRDSVSELQAEAVTVEVGDVLAHLSRRADLPYDIVFLDPPFAADLLEESCRLLQSNAWLADGAAVYIEQEKRQSLPPLPDAWQVEKDKRAGNVRYLLVRAAPTEGSDK